MHCWYNFFRLCYRTLCRPSDKKGRSLTTCHKFTPTKKIIDSIQHLLDPRTYANCRLHMHMPIILISIIILFLVMCVPPFQKLHTQICMSNLTPHRQCVNNLLSVFCYKNTIQFHRFSLCVDNSHALLPMNIGVSMLFYGFLHPICSL